MNAYELADLIDSEDTLWLEGKLSDISTMLRQQQAEIEALKTEQKVMFGFVKSRNEVGQFIIYKSTQEAQE